MYLNWYFQLVKYQELITNEIVKDDIDRTCSIFSISIFQWFMRIVQLHAS